MPNYDTVSYFGWADTHSSAARRLLKTSISYINTLIIVRMNFVHKRKQRCILASIEICVFFQKTLGDHIFLQCNFYSLWIDTVNELGITLVFTFSFTTVTSDNEFGWTILLENKFFFNIYTQENFNFYIFNFFYLVLEDPGHTLLWLRYN